MSRFVVVLLLTCLHMGSVYGIDCTYGSDKSFFDHMLTTCPRITDSADKTYCCIDLSDNSAYCCTAEQFALKTGFGIIIPVIILVTIVVALIVCCVSCLCCSCCPGYRRRHGTVYGKVHTPVVQVIQSQPNIPSSYTSQPAQNYVPPYPTTEMPQPPSYTNEAYAKQSPYNPNYQPSQ